MTAPPSLAQGYRRFRAGRLKLEADLYRRLGQGQSPRIMIVACADSRVDPATIFDAGPGELFIVRNVANLVPPYAEHVQGSHHGTSAALEFAVENLRVEHVVVMGHGQCGGIAACIASGENLPVGRFITPWVGMLEGVCRHLRSSLAAAEPEALQLALEYAGIKHSLENLKGFPFIARALAERRLSLHGAWFSIGSGELRWLDSGGAFTALR